MCLYETEIKNLKYQPNKKNGGIAPACTDLRLATIKTACGWCEECRKKLANEWRIRLYEEIKDDNKDCYFVTLTFSPAAIKKLEMEIHLKKWHGIENEDGEMETDVNDIAAYAIRKWSERWRKKHKKAPKHWLITELGHNGSERIHLHGLIWGKPDEIEKTWQYGYMYTGQWVDERTINYIMKYVTKLDADHKGYKQKIFTSKGMGKGYIKKMGKRHKYNGEETIIHYKTKQGSKIGLPRYYKEKLWNPEEREKIWKNQLDKKELYLKGEIINTESDTETFIKKLKAVRKTNELAGYGDNTTGNKKYIVTELMRSDKEKINLNKEKYVQCTERRYVDSTKENDNEKISKDIKKTIIYYGNYHGTTTQAQREYNKLLDEARDKGISVRVLRLIKEGIIVDNFVNKS